MLYGSVTVRDGDEAVAVDALALVQPEEHLGNYDYKYNYNYLSLSLSLYIYIYMYICVHTYIHIYIYIYIYVYIYIYIHRDAAFQDVGFLNTY